MTEYAKGVYPRACGGTSEIEIEDAMRIGLSPRLRGNRYAAARALAGEGSIPAPAGEPGALAFRGLLREVYPRACGGTS